MPHQISETIDAGPSEPDHCPLAAPPTEFPGLDGWETDGGACGTGAERPPDPKPVGNAEADRRNGATPWSPGASAASWILPCVEWRHAHGRPDRPGGRRAMERHAPDGAALVQSRIPRRLSL